MYCWNCGHKNPDSNKYCGECGKIQGRPMGAEAPSGPEMVSAIDSFKSRERRKGGSEITSVPRPRQQTKITEPLVEYSPPKSPMGPFNRRASDKIWPVSTTANLPEPVPSDFGLHPAEVQSAGESRLATPSAPTEIPKPVNPLVGEPGAVREILK